MKMRLVTVLPCLVLAVSTSAEPTKSRFFKTSDRVKIHYLEAGNGRPIVFIPGWTMPAWIWQKQIDEFSQKYHVIAVDPRSQGESDKPPYGHLGDTRASDYKELVDQLGLKKPVLVGWSLACSELVKYAEQFGTDNVGGLVLVDGYLYDKASPEVSAAWSERMTQLQQDRRKLTETFVRSMFKKPQTEDYLGRIVDASLQVPADTAAVLVYNMLSIKNMSVGFEKLTRPVLYVYQPNMQASADFIKSKLSQKVQLERFDGDGHALFVDDPEKFNGLLEAFLQGLPN